MMGKLIDRDIEIFPINVAIVSLNHVNFAFSSFIIEILGNEDSKKKT